MIPGLRHVCCSSSSSSLLVVHFPSLLLSPTSFLTSHPHLKFRLTIFYFVKKNCLFFSISYFCLASYFILSCQFQPHLTFSISTVTQSSPLNPQLSTSLSSLPTPSSNIFALNVNFPICFTRQQHNLPTIRRY